MQNDSADTTSTERWVGIPFKRQGETFTRYWARLNSAQVVALHAATVFIGIGPQSFFDSYLKTEE